MGSRVVVEGREGTEENPFVVSISDAKAMVAYYLLLPINLEGNLRKNINFHRVVGIGFNARALRHLCLPPPVLMTGEHYEEPVFNNSKTDFSHQEQKLLCARITLLV